MKQKLFNELLDSIKEAGKELKMSKVICTKCNVKMEHVRSGVYVLETYEDGEKPYKVWSADRYICPNCDTELVTGFGHGPISEQFHDNFKEWVVKCEFKFK